MENTLENKQKFFDLYSGQPVICNNRFICKYTPRLIDDRFLKNAYAELKSMVSITDDDALEVSKLFTESEILILDECRRQYYINLVKTHVLPSRTVRGDVSDLLRLKGYALPYNCVSVEEQINRGWTKLIQ